MSNEGYGSQPKPVPNSNRSAHDGVIEDMRTRKEFGLAKYGSLLQAGNGRDQLQDAYEEALDLCVYLRAALDERDGQPLRKVQPMKTVEQVEAEVAMARALTHEEYEEAAIRRDRALTNPPVGEGT